MRGAVGDANTAPPCTLLRTYAGSLSACGWAVSTEADAASIGFHEKRSLKIGAGHADMIPA